MADEKNSDWKKEETKKELAYFREEFSKKGFREVELREYAENKDICESRRIVVNGEVICFLK